MGRFDTGSLLFVLALACTLQVSAAAAQQSSPPAPTAAPAPSAPREMPTPEQLEPGVNTSPSVTEAPSGIGAAPAPGTASSSEGGKTSAGGKAPANTPGEKAGTESARQVAASPAARKGPDRLQLDATEITGNRELPKVLYIVPWKRSDLGDLTGRPVNSLLDEVLQPLDRDVFQRENRYYNGLKPPAAAPQGGAPGGPGSNP